MPIFDYKCRSCNHQFEKIVRSGDIPSCPSCQADDLEQLLSVPGISTERSRQNALGKARQVAGKTQREQIQAQREYEAKHRDHH